MQEFRNKVAVITGAASGIGKAMAQRYAREGMHLVLADIERMPLEATAEELRQAGAKVAFERTDVCKPEDLQTLADAAFDTFGAVHLLCNNAGVLPPGAPVWGETLGVWHWAMGVNFYGVLHGLQAFVPRMLASQEEGHIVNTASLAGLISRPLMSAYNVSKYAVVALSECLYGELKVTTGKLHVSVLCPAFANTRLAESARNRPEAVEADPSASFGFHDAIKQQVATGTPPEQIVDAVMDAIRAERFWILTHPHLEGGIRDRFESILNRTNPPLRDLRSQSTPLW